jgi:hypothetical protein
VYRYCTRKCLYDLARSRYFPELTRELTMKIGGECSSDKVSKANLGPLAEDAGLAKPLVRRHVSNLAETVSLNLDKNAIKHPVAGTLAEQNIPAL